jgi:F-type H+-transporting ATPase subunit b
MGGPFSIEPGLILWAWLVFGALLFLLWKYAWPAIVRATEEREGTIARQLEEAEKMNAEAKVALEEHRQLLAGAKEEAQGLLAEAKSAAESERQQLLAKARTEQEQILDRAKREIDAERDRAITDLRREAVDLSLAAAARLVEERLDSTADRKLVQDYLGSLGDAH